jgi:hypothetical protein
VTPAEALRSGLLSELVEPNARGLAGEAANCQNDLVYFQQVVAGSNPATPTKILPSIKIIPKRWFGVHRQLRQILRQKRAPATAPSNCSRQSAGRLHRALMPSARFTGEPELRWIAEMRWSSVVAGEAFSPPPPMG